MRILKGRILHVDDCTLVLVKDKDMSPFSWLHFIVMNEADYERSGEMIISHEEQHIHCHHWADLLLAQAVIILCWFNPAAWLMRKELQTVHEYEADQCVLDDGVNARDYQMLLLKMAVGARFPSFANSLNHSIIKKRITMMNNQSTDARRRIRVLALAPALVLAVLATNIPCVASTLSAATTTTLVSEDGSKGSNNSANEQMQEGQLIKISASNNNIHTVKADGYRVDGKEVTSIENLKPEDIASISVNVENGKTYVDVTTKKMQSEKVVAQLQESNIPLEQLQQLQTNVTELNNNGGTNIEISFAGVKDFSVQSGDFIIKDQAQYHCTKVNNSIAEDGAVHVKLHTDEIIGDDVKTFYVQLQTTLGRIVVPIRRGE